MPFSLSIFCILYRYNNGSYYSYVERPVFKEKTDVPSKRKRNTFHRSVINDTRIKVFDWDISSYILTKLCIAESPINCFVSNVKNRIKLFCRSFIVSSINKSISFWRWASYTPPVWWLARGQNQRAAWTFCFCARFAKWVMHKNDRQFLICTKKQPSARHDAWSSMEAHARSRRTSDPHSRHIAGRLTVAATQFDSWAPWADGRARFSTTLSVPRRRFFDL